MQLSYDVLKILFVLFLWYSKQSVVFYPAKFSWSVSYLQTKQVSRSLSYSILGNLKKETDSEPEASFTMAWLD